MGSSRDKYRLYLAMYDNSRAVGAGYPTQIHWALLVGPKHEDPDSLQKTHVRYHATNYTRSGRWEFERRPVECVRSPSMLGRILLGKVDRADLANLERMLADPRRIKAGQPHWNCWKWVEEALSDLVQKGVLYVRARGGLDVRHLLTYGQRFSAEIVARELNAGYGLPITIAYTGPERYVRAVLRLCILAEERP
ncbi:hypothetical protein BN946_scf185013.g34 [Trametes cinnabarina]|uniref:Uncharacterized protein n=1 Tax=Pycnoporus cinnabarinus TaxID=5643 RepID=A0A060SGA1_PYCCI|nr:hypothetical protein BN946_scf185013.g34 [Trametes cinnabarina]